VAGGAREITLLGQNVNAWSGQDDKGRAIGLDGLIRALAAEPDLARIRYTTSHPNDMSEA
jgi:tRNA-2-methylthio-N6-dimethylallyladenosine synthase